MGVKEQPDEPVDRTSAGKDPARATCRRARHSPPAHRQAVYLPRRVVSAEPLAGQLARFSPRVLRDIRITPADRENECNKPFWRL
jgi:hypothetical protein